MMPFYWLALGLLAVWRITHLLHAEDGPWALIARARRYPARGFGRQLWDCFYCLSLWVALPCAVLIAATWKEGILLALSFSAGAILLERATGPNSPPAIYYEEKENDHVMLRTSEDAPAPAERPSTPTTTPAPTGPRTDA